MQVQFKAWLRLKHIKVVDLIIIAVADKMCQRLLQF